MGYQKEDAQCYAWPSLLDKKTTCHLIVTWSKTDIQWPEAVLLISKRSQFRERNFHFLSVFQKDLVVGQGLISAFSQKEG